MRTHLRTCQTCHVCKHCSPVLRAPTCQPPPTLVSNWRMSKVSTHTPQALYNGDLIKTLFPLSPVHHALERRANGVRSCCSFCSSICQRQRVENVSAQIHHSCWRLCSKSYESSWWWTSSLTPALGPLSYILTHFRGHILSALLNCVLLFTEAWWTHEILLLTSHSVLLPSHGGFG